MHTTTSLKYSIFVALFLNSTAVLSGTLGPVCIGYGLSGACAETAFDAAINTLYLQPNSDLFQSAATLSAGSATVNLGLHPTWSWGFQIDAGYHINALNALSINWYDYRENTAKSYPASGLSYAYPTGSIISAQYNAVYQSVHLEWDQINFEYSERLELSAYNRIRLHGGAQYSRLANSGYSNYNSFISVNGSVPNATYFNIQSDATYNGFGPRVGGDFDYMLRDGVRVYAKAAVALLAGSSKSNFLGNRVVNIGYNHAIVVPELDAKLGGLYTYSLPSSNVNIDLGWLWANYFNALTTMISSQSTASQTTNFGLQGLYFGLQWLGNVV